VNSKTLQELEDSDWGDPATGETPLIQKCLALRREPIGDFSIENLRLLIGQQMGLKFLLPLAMSHLNHDPLSEGDLYPGDLLQSVLRVPFDSWQETEELLALRAQLPPVAREFLNKAREMDDESKAIFGELIKAAEDVANFH
jgi:hypothetical protein